MWLRINKISFKNSSTDVSKHVCECLSINSVSELDSSKIHRMIASLHSILKWPQLSLTRWSSKGWWRGARRHSSSPTTQTCSNMRTTSSSWLLAASCTRVTPTSVLHQSYLSQLFWLIDQFGCGDDSGCCCCPALILLFLLLSCWQVVDDDDDDAHDKLQSLWFSFSSISNINYSLRADLEQDSQHSKDHASEVRIALLSNYALIILISKTGHTCNNINNLYHFYFD